MNTEDSRILKSSYLRNCQMERRGKMFMLSVGTCLLQVLKKLTWLSHNNNNSHGNDRSSSYIYRHSSKVVIAVPIVIIMIVIRVKVILTRTMLKRVDPYEHLDCHNSLPRPLIRILFRGVRI